MTEPCRILVLNERDPLHPKAGGAESHVFEIFGRLARQGYSVTAAVAGFEGGAAQERVQDVEVRRLGRLAAYYPRVPLFCARETRRGHFDVVVECLNKIPFFSPLYSKVPVLAICHHLFGEVAFQQVSLPIATAVWSAERFLPLVYKKLRFVSISESSKEDLVGRGIPAEQIRVSHCGIDPSPVCVDPAVLRPPRVCYVGRVEPYKNVDVMLKALASLAPRFPELEIIIMGRGSALPQLEQLARELGLADRTRFAGFVSNQERDEILASSRVCVCPSEKEGWGLTVIESNAVGTPVVASDAQGLRDSVRDGETGFLVEIGDVAGFAKYIEALLHDDELSLRMTRDALAWAERFDWDLAAREMADEIAIARSTS